MSGRGAWRTSWRTSWRVARIVPIAALTAACAGDPQPPSMPPPQRPAAGLVGDWVRLTPRRLRGDTLTLRADSTADGIILWDDRRDAVARHWVARFGSRTPATARTDWRDGYQDGGDFDCIGGHDTTGCVSMPVLCLGAPGEYSCQAFKYVAPDSLHLAEGSSFVRAGAARAAGDSGAPGRPTRR